MSGPPYLNFYPSDYLTDTQDLSCEEHGAYLLLLFAAWNQDDCSLPDDDRKLARIVRLSPRKWACVRNAIASFWTVENGRWRNARLSAERAKVDQKSESNRKSADARWEKERAEKQGKGGMRSQSERNAISELRYTLLPDGNNGAFAPNSDLADGVFKIGHFVLSEAGHADQRRRGSVIGRWRHLAGQDDARLLRKIIHLLDTPQADPVAWMTAALRPENHHGPRPRHNRNDDEPVNPFVRAAIEREDERAAAER